MHSEHEDHMRAEYDTYYRLGRDMFEAGTEAEIDRMEDQQSEIARRWQQGPHAEHWNYLADAEHDWEHAPDTMRRFMDNVAFNREHHTGLAALTDVQVRSQEQARELTGNDRPQPRRERGRGR
ncbi:hypothetical protein [Nocardia bovistercoris]|uniref:Uncharacterized protein n=1 Tax=Nocardia bovistercoris TaxID=2785916 RepID=A0A931N1L4_9NOCA|nr:hypothetical protein [Nocardia bovistercoris]MBH0775056.1 hypothetical protein [Nocardia bovistercoris]